MIGSFALLLLLLYGIGLALAGLWVGRQVRGSADFYVARHRLGPGLLAATVLAANIGAGSTVGATGRAYEIGASAWWWVGSAALGTLVLARWVGPRMWREARQRGCYTVGDYLESRYCSGVRAMAMTILWVGSLAILAGQLVAMGEVLHAAAAVPRPVGAAVGALVVLVYYSAGGLWSASLVNVVELCVKLIAFPAAVVVTARAVGGIEAVVAATHSMGSAADSYLSPIGIGWLGVMGYVGVLGPSFVISPGLLQKAFGGRSEAAVRRGLTISGLALLVFAAVPTSLGLLARAQWPAITDPDSVLPRLLVELLPGGLGLLTLAAVLSAELSSADAVLFMLSTSLSKDFYQGYWNREVDDRGLLIAGRVAALIGLVLGLLAALTFSSVIGTLTVFYGLLVIALAVPLIGGLYFHRPDSRAALTAMTVSLIVASVALVVSGGPKPAGFWPYLLGVGAGAVACWAASPSARS
ncbi:MAG: sodium:solute symporter family protein [Acidobacteriota bacterium]